MNISKTFFSAAIAAGLACTAMAVSTADYVQSGLIGHWDGIDNVGTGSHDLSAATWKDLSGATGDFTVHDAMGSFVGNGLKKIANGYMASRSSRRTGILTIEAVISGIPNVNGWAMPLFVSKDQHVSINEGRVSGSRLYFFDYKNYGIQVSEKPSRTTIAVVYESATKASKAYINGAEPTATLASNDWGDNNTSMTIGGRAQSGGGELSVTGYTVHAIRLYDRALTAAEAAANYEVDAMRFTPGTYTWTGATSSDWADASNWTTGGVVAARAPNGGDAVVLPAGASVTLSANVGGLTSLTFEGAATINGAYALTAATVSFASATLTLGADTAVEAYVVTRGGAPLARGIYAGADGTGSVVVEWISGSGVVRTAGATDGIIPSIVPTPAGDGWYEFGVGTYSMNQDSAYDGNTRPYVSAQWCQWQNYAFPAGAKLRFKGGVLVDTIPAGWFSEVDTTSALKQITPRERAVFADGTALVIPVGAEMRYTPGTWVYSGTGNKYYNIAFVSGSSFTNDLVVNGKLYIKGDGTAIRYSNQVFEGAMSGSGEIYLTNYSNHGRFTGSSFGFTGKVTYNSDAGGTIAVLSPVVEGTMSLVTMIGCSGKYETNNSYCATGLMFGPQRGNPTAQGELRVASIGGDAGAFLDKNGNVRRRGGTVLVWGTNTVHAGTVTSSLHVLARGGDQNCSNGNFSDSSVPKFGTGNFIADNVSNGATLFLGTNVYVLVGKVTGNSKFDYSQVKNAINGMTLDITNGCPSGAEVKATDIGMLPARLSGFAGSVTLTDTATKSYTMPIDFTHGTNYLYNKVGCIGSGTLDSAPASGSIDVTFPTTGDKPVKGEYALARFTSGGELLSGWTVTLNGAPASTTVAMVRGMSIEVKKDATGLWLDVRQPGMLFTFR